jgi:hypothetical protein
MNDFNSSSLTSDIGHVKDEMEALGKEIENVVKKLSGLSTGLNSAMSSTSGAQNTGAGQLKLGSSGNNLLSRSFGTFSRMAGIAGPLVKGAFGVAGAAIVGMPNVDTTIGMATGAYGAGIISGRSYGAINQGTFNGLRGGMNIAGAPGVISQSLSSQGILYGGGGLAGGAGQYGNILRAIKGSAKYMNISNDVASQAIGGMYSGSSSMSMLQNFGIYTTNPNGGKSASPVQTLAMLNDRLTGGGRMSAKQVATSLGPGGLMRANLESIQDPTTRAMAEQYMRDASKGKFWNSKTYGSELAKVGGGNPQQAQMTALTSQTQTMVTATSSYVEGMNKATIAIKKFEGVLNNFLKTPQGQALAQLNGGANLAMKDPAIAGGAGLAAAIGNAGSDLASNLLTNRFLNRLEGKAGSKGGKHVKAPSLGKKIGKMGVKGAGIFSLLMGGTDLLNDMSNGQGFGSKQFNSDLGSTIGGFAGTTLGALVPVPGLDIATALLGGQIGSAIGGAVGGMFEGGATNINGLGGSSDTTGAVKLVAPVSSRYPITAKYGQKTDAHGTKLWGGNAHKAIDYGVPSGTTVQAAGSGTVSETGTGSGSRSYGNYIIIDHGSGVSTLYAHLSSLQVSKGDKVSQGQSIALSGATGYVTGPHLHFETRKNGQPVNPASLGLSGSVAVVAGNTDATASSNSSGSIGSSGSASSLGFSSGASAGATKIPSSYMGSAIGSGVTGNFLSATSATNSKFGTGAGSNTNVGGPNLDVGSAGSSNKKNYVNITVNVASATEAEARKLAKMVKDYLEEDKLMNNMRTL